LNRGSGPSRRINPPQYSKIWGAKQSLSYELFHNQAFKLGADIFAAVTEYGVRKAVHTSIITGFIGSNIELTKDPPSS
jgi:hypothetical protein